MRRTFSLTQKQWNQWHRKQERRPIPRQLWINGPRQGLWKLQTTGSERFHNVKVIQLKQQTQPQIQRQLQILF